MSGRELLLVSMNYLTIVRTAVFAGYRTPPKRNMVGIGETVQKYIIHTTSKVLASRFSSQLTVITVNGEQSWFLFGKLPK